MTNIYNLVEEISVNEISKSIRARRKLDGTIVFVKSPNDNSSIDPEIQAQLLTRSFDLQRKIRCASITTASRIVGEKS